MNKLNHHFVVLCLSVSFVANSYANATPQEDISLNMAVQMALKKNFAVRIAEITPEISEAEIKRSQSKFDPRVRASYQEVEYQAGAVSPATERNEERYASAGISAEMPWGTTVDLSANATETAEVSNTTLSVRQPLLRNGGLGSNMLEIHVARKNHEIDQLTFVGTVMQVLRDTIFGYNDAALARENHEVTKRSRDLARRLVSDNKRRVEVGSMVPIAVTVAETQLALRESSVLSAEQAYFEALNRLRSLITSNSKNVLDTRFGEIALPEPKEFKVNTGADFEYAIANRPRLRSAWVAIERSRLQAKEAKRDTLPKIDIVAGYRWNSNNPGKNELFGDFLERDDEDLFLGIEFERPILNRGERAAKDIARLNLRREELEYERIEQVVTIQLDNGARRLDTEWKRIKVTQRARELAELSLKAEERKLQLGTSQVFFVLDLQEDLANAEIREKAAIAEYNKAIADYELLRGSLLENWGIRL